MKRSFLIVSILIALILLPIFVFTTNNAANEETSSKTNSVQTPAKEPQTVSQTASAFYYPMTDLEARIKYRWFGKYVDGNDKVPDCGNIFNGYHNAVDLEVSESEKSIDVPIYAISDGTVRVAQNVSGYGGLLIIGTNINGQDLTINYGHVRLGSIPFKVGDSVKSGQKLGVLGSGCSFETSGERKHLHLAIHKGVSVDVMGYLPNQASLSSWIDPKAFLSGLAPNQPK